MKSIKAEIVDLEEFNSNNAWGFGGSIGTRTTYSNGYYRRKGRSCFRHSGTTPFDLFYKPQPNSRQHGERISKESFFEVCKP